MYRNKVGMKSTLHVHVRYPVLEYGGKERQGRLHYSDYDTFCNRYRREERDGGREIERKEREGLFLVFV